MDKQTNIETSNNNTNNDPDSNSSMRCSNPHASDRDEIDFVSTAVAGNNNNNNYNYSHNNNNNNYNIFKEMDEKLMRNKNINNNNLNGSLKNKNIAAIPLPQEMPNPLASKSEANITEGRKCEMEEQEKKATTRGRLSLFSFNKKFIQKSSNTSKSLKSPTTTPVSTTASIIASNTSKTMTNSPGHFGTTICPGQKMVPLIPARAVSLENFQTGGCGLEESGFSEKLAMTPAIDSTYSSPVRQHKFVKSSSISRFLGNTYNAKKFEREEQKRLANDGKFHTFAGRRRHRLNGPHLERFRQCSNEDGDSVDAEATTLDLHDHHTRSRHNDLSRSVDHPEEEDCDADFSTKAMRKITRGLGKLWWRRSNSVEISTPDPEYKVTYLGNVLTGWSKGEGCVEKQLNTLWRNYTQNTKPDVVMRIKVCASGLKATTRQHGLTEYWANRITHCCAPKNYPRVFCWIYRHEGRKLKHELRCHAVLCSKEKIVQEICSTLKENLECALREFRREKFLKQNARLSLANAAYENPSLPRRKILLSVGGNNYRPPLERSKSAPKLMAIEEAIGEEEGDDVEETNEPEMRSCCQKDSLYPAMTLGRRRCRRGHSIRRTGKARPTFCEHEGDYLKAVKQVEDVIVRSGNAVKTKENQNNQQNEIISEEQRHSYGSDDSDDFEKLLKGNDYDTGTSLTNELLPYFDLHLQKQTSNSLGSLNELKRNDNDDDDDDVEIGNLSLFPNVNSNPSAEAADDDFDDRDEIKGTNSKIVSLRKTGVCSDGEEEFSDDEERYFRQASILNMLHRNSMRKMSQIVQSSDESSLETTASAHHLVQSSISSNASSTLTSTSATDKPDHSDAEMRNRKSAPVSVTDSDEGSISSGCETASTVTGNQDDTSLRYRQSKPLPPFMQLAVAYMELHAEEEPPATLEEIYQRLKSRLDGRHGSDATNFSTSSSVTLKLASSPTPSLNGTDVDAPIPAIRRKSRRDIESGDSDSDGSDESGYVEYLAGDGSSRPVNTNHDSLARPQLPPKPMPRRTNGVSRVVTTTVV